MPGRVGGSPVTVIEIEGEARVEHITEACDRLICEQRVGTLAELTKIGRLDSAIGLNNANTEPDMRGDRPPQCFVLCLAGPLICIKAEPRRRFYDRSEERRVGKECRCERLGG